MTMTADIPQSTAAALPLCARLRPDTVLNLRDGERYLARAGQRFLAVSLFIAAAGLLLFARADVDAAEALARLLITLVLVLGAAGLWQAGTPRPRPELELDLMRRQVRLVRRTRGGGFTVQRIDFATLGRAEFQGRSVVIWLQSGEMLAAMGLSDDAARDRLRAALRQEGVAA